MPVASVEEIAVDPDGRGRGREAPSPSRSPSRGRSGVVREHGLERVETARPRRRSRRSGRPGPRGVNVDLPLVGDARHEHGTGVPWRSAARAAAVRAQTATQAKRRRGVDADGNRVPTRGLRPPRALSLRRRDARVVGESVPLHRRTRRSGETLTSRYSVSRCTGVLPSALIRWTSSSVEVRWVVPAAETTFSSIITEPMSSAPKPSATWPILRPCVTQELWMWSTLSR